MRFCSLIIPIQLLPSRLAGAAPLITVHLHMPLTLEAHSAPSDPTVGSDAKVSHFMKVDRWADHLPMGVLVTNTMPNVKSGRR